jgi:hypothetical protein
MSRSHMSVFLSKRNTETIEKRIGQKEREYSYVDCFHLVFWGYTGYYAFALVPCFFYSSYPKKLEIAAVTGLVPRKHGNQA